MEEEDAIIPSSSPMELAQPSAVRQDNETSVPKMSPPVRRQTRSESRMTGYVILSILDPPTDDDSEQEGSLTRSIDSKESRTVLLRHGYFRQRLLISAVDS